MPPNSHPPPAANADDPAHSLPSSPPAANATFTVTQALGLATVMAQLFLSTQQNKASVHISPPAQQPVHLAVPPACSSTTAATEVTTTTQPPPTVLVTRGRRPTAKQTPKPTAGKRQSSRLAAKYNGMFVDMTDKAVQRRALQDSLASCSQAVQQHVTRRGLLNKNKAPIAIPDLRKLVRAAGLGCSTAESVDAVSPSRQE